MNRVLIIFFLLLLAVALSSAQDHPIPPGVRSANRAAEQLDRALAPQNNPVEQPNLVQMQHDAKELAALSNSIPSDISQTAQGVLPKDVVNKLKRIEKLAKRLRSQIYR